MNKFNLTWIEFDMRHLDDVHESMYEWMYKVDINGCIDESDKELQNQSCKIKLIDNRKIDSSNLG